jgi:uncharacterized protein YoxC
MDNIKKYFQLVIILVLLVALAVNIVTQPDTTEVNKFIIERKIDSLNNAITKNNILLEEHANNIALLSDSVLNLNKRVKQNDNKLSDLKNKYNEAIDNAAKFTSNDITMFFTERYK